MRWIVLVFALLVGCDSCNEDSTGDSLPRDGSIDGAVDAGMDGG